jgi:hypothetical protein
MTNVSHAGQTIFQVIVLLNNIEFILVAVFCFLSIRRRFYRVLPVFCGFMVFICIFDLINSFFLDYSVYYMLRHSREPLMTVGYYQVVIRIIEPTIEVLELAVGLEIVVRSLRSWAWIPKLVIAIFRWAWFALLVLAVVAFVSGTSRTLSGIIETQFAITRSIQIMLCGLIFLLFLCQRLLAYPFEKSILLVAVGLTMQATFSLIVSSIIVHFGRARPPGYHYDGYSVLGGMLDFVYLAMFYLAIFQLQEDSCSSPPLDSERSVGHLNRMTELLSRVIRN